MALSLTIVFAMYGALAAWEALAPARAFPRPRLWRTRGALFFAAYLAVAASAPFLWDELLASHTVFDLTGLGTALGAVVGLLVSQLATYWWHRALHRSNTLWRLFHQVHHSAERLDVWSAWMFSPLDVLAFAFVGSLALVGLVGLTPEAALAVNLVTMFLTMFTHANVATPRWLGYLVHRPESHALHHGRGIHGFNYCELPLWDIVFGTFRNPTRFDAPVGFYDGASDRLGAMLLGRDVASERPAPRSAPARDPQPA